MLVAAVLGDIEICPLDWFERETWVFRSSVSLNRALPLAVKKSRAGPILGNGNWSIGPTSLVLDKYKTIFIDYIACVALIFVHILVSKNAHVANLIGCYAHDS